VLQALSYPMQVIIGHFIYNSTVKTLNGQGTGRFTDEEIAAFREEIWSNINELLLASKSKLSGGQKAAPFWVLGGDKPTEADTTLFGFIVSVLLCDA
jgi:hypothetical protein